MQALTDCNRLEENRGVDIIIFFGSPDSECILQLKQWPSWGHSNNHFLNRSCHKLLHTSAHHIILPCRIFMEILGKNDVILPRQSRCHVLLTCGSSASLSHLSPATASHLGARLGSGWCVCVSVCWGVCVYGEGG